MTEEDKRALRPLVRELRGNLTQPQFTAKLGYEGDRAAKLEQFGPTSGALPRLARCAVECDRHDLAQQFVNAFLGDFPDLLPVLAALNSIQNAPISGQFDITDAQTRKLCADVDRVIKSGKASAIRALELSIEMAVALSKMGG